VELADLGSGGGLPGIPLATARPDLSFALIEARQRRVAFLELVVESLSLENVQILPTRVESVRADFDGCLARAFGNAERSWEAASGLLRPDGALVYFAGRSWSPTALRAHPSPEDDVQFDVCSPIEFPWQGPLVIMSRGRPAPAP
jgi:16S rRNA (guanine527-N7)-methyltransferase